MQQIGILMKTGTVNNIGNSNDSNNSNDDNNGTARIESILGQQTAYTVIAIR